MASASTITAPLAASRADTVDLPDPMPPVSPTRITPGTVPTPGPGRQGRGGSQPTACSEGLAWRPHAECAGTGAEPLRRPFDPRCRAGRGGGPRRRRATAHRVAPRRARRVAPTPRAAGAERRAGEPSHASGRYAQSSAPPLAPFRWVAIAVGLVGRVSRPQRHQLPPDPRRRRADRVRRLPHHPAHPLHRRPHHGRAGAGRGRADHGGGRGDGHWDVAVHVLPLDHGDAGRFQPGLGVRRTPHADLRRDHQRAAGVRHGQQPCRRHPRQRGVVRGVGRRSRHSGVARQVSRESARQQSLALDRLGRLADANALLFSLHRVAQTLPASLDLDEVLDSTMSRLRDLFDFDSAAVLLLDETDGTWVRGPAGRATACPARPSTDDAPRAARAGPSTRAGRPSTSRTSLVAGGPGPGARARTRASTRCLRARGSLDRPHRPRAHRGPTTSATATSSCSTGFVEPAALAIDNARWFARLRTVGADEERTRIARDLHDRIGQSLAYLAFELDRIVTSRRPGRARRARRSSNCATTSAA